jgi:peptidoglycan/xylan/chitin deacetylase (PgdA/CDA1 family)
MAVARRRRPFDDGKQDSGAIDRRQALQAAALAATALSLAAACDSGSGPTPSQPPVSSSGPAVPTSAAASPSPTALALPAEVASGPRNRPNVALTFHGQGTTAQVTALLAELARGGAHGTVLAVGTWLQSEPALAKRILDGGHELGNHTQNHLAIAGMDAAHAFTEIDACAAVLRRLTGSIGTWFRPSQTQTSTPVIRAQATRVGYPTCLSYDLDTLDYTDPGSAAITHTTLSLVRNGSIISMHCGHPQTITAMPAILDGLRQRGLHPVTMTELVRS